MATTTQARRGVRGGRAGLALPAGVFLLVIAMAMTIAGIPVPPLFRPGTWLILIALLVITAGAVVRVTGAADHE